MPFFSSDFGSENVTLVRNVLSSALDLITVSYYSISNKTGFEIFKIAVFNAVNIHSHCAGVSHWSNPRVLSLQCFCFDILPFAYYVTLHCSFVMYRNMISGSKTNGNWETTRRDKLLGIFPLKHQAFVSSVSPSMLG